MVDLVFVGFKESLVLLFSPRKGKMQLLDDTFCTDSHYLQDGMSSSDKWCFASAYKKHCL